MRSLLNRLMVAFGANAQLCKLAGREIKLQRTEIDDLQGQIKRLKLELQVSDPESHLSNTTDEELEEMIG